MRYSLKDYENEENGVQGKYLEYYDEQNGKRFTNAEYFIFDTNCDEFKAIMNSTGGFCADMTTRMIEKLSDSCESIMLCQTPQNSNAFLFQFVYLGNDKEVLHIKWDNNYFDYEYFKNKFADCIIEEGCIFDLLKYDCLKEVTKEFKTPTVQFGIEINGKEIGTNDVLVCEDLCFIKNEFVEQIRTYGVKYAELRHDFDVLGAEHFKAIFVKEDDSLLPKYQGELNYKTIKEFREDYGEGEEFFIKPYEMIVPISLVKQLSSHFTLKETDLEEEIDFE